MTARRRPPSNVMIAAAIASLCGLLPSLAVSQPAKLVGGTRPEVSHEIPQIASLSVATVNRIRGLGIDQTAVSGTPEAAQRATLATGGATYRLVGLGSADVPRRMASPSGAGGVAFLIQIPLDADAASAGTRTYYALATALNSRIKVWAFYEDLPGDAELVRKMTAVLAGLEQPRIVFDPKFKTPPGDDPERYVLH